MFNGTKRSKALFTLFPALLLLGVSAMALPLTAQGVSYTTVSKGEFGGGLGTLMRLVPGADDESRQTTHFQGAFMRTDSDDNSTIMNFGEGRFTELEHPEKSYFTYTLEEMMAALSTQVAQAGAQADMEEPEAEPAQEPDVTFEVKLSSERTGRTMEIHGYRAEQFLVTIEMVPTSEEAVQEAADSGSLAVLTEIWASRDVPGWEELKKAQMEAAEAMGSGNMGSQAEALQQALASDPRMQEAYAENLKTMEEMDGLAVKTVVYFVVVPPAQELNKSEVLAMEGKPISEGVGGVLGDAAKDAAVDQARGAVRNLTRGILGRRQQEEEKPPVEEVARQVILMRVTSNVVDVKTGPLPDELFQHPADYRQKDPPWKGVGGSR